MDIKKDRRVVLEVISKYVALLKKNSVMFDTIYLFGSYVNGTYNEDSDIDVAIILKKKEIDRFNERLKLMRLRWDIDLRIEPHPFSKNDFDRNDPFVKEIVTNGEKIV